MSKFFSSSSSGIICRSICNMQEKLFIQFGRFFQTKFANFLCKKLTAVRLGQQDSEAVG